MNASANSTRPTVRGPKPNLRNAQIANIDSKIACEQVTRNDAAAIARSAGRRSSKDSAPARGGPAVGVRRSGAWLSRRTKKTSAIATRLNAAESTAGRKKLAV